jgi:hypothetical protein
MATTAPESGWLNRMHLPYSSAAERRAAEGLQLRYDGLVLNQWG